MSVLEYLIDIETLDSTTNISTAIGLLAGTAAYGLMFCSGDTILQSMGVLMALVASICITHKEGKL